MTDTYDTIGGGVRGLLIAAGPFNERVWADDAPAKPTFPYSTIDDAITTGPELSGDGKTLMIVRTLQVNIWEKIGAEDQDVTRAVFAALDGQRVAVEATVTRLRITDTQRLVERDTSIVHRALTITARHDPTAL